MINFCIFENRVNIFVRSKIHHITVKLLYVQCTDEVVISPFSFYPSSRTMLSFLSGIYVYVIAWALLGQDSGDSLGPTHQSNFAVSKIIGLVSH